MEEQSSDVPDDGEPLLNLKQAAATLGVHYMTIYRYVRQGLIAAERDGTEWRIRRQVLNVFATGQSAPRSERASTAAPWDQRLETCLLSGDETSSWKVVEAALAAGHLPEYCYLDMITASLASIGERSATGDIGVAERHLATAVAVRLVSRLGARFRRPGRSRGTVVLGAPSGEIHALSVSIVSDLIRFEGYDVLELGANVPPEAFSAAASRTARLACVGIAITRSESLASAQTVVNAVRTMNGDVPIVLSGLALSEEARSVLEGVTAVARDSRETVAIVRDFEKGRSARRVV